MDNDAPTPTPGVAADPTPIEEFFELQAGKNEDGTPKVSKVDKAELLRLAQLGFGSNERFEEAKGIKAQMQELARQLGDKTKVFDVLKALGHDPDALIQERYLSTLQETMKTPEQRHLEELERDATEYRRLMQEKQKQEQEAQVNAEATRIRTELYGKIEGALEALGVRATKHAVAQVALHIKQLAQQAEQRGEAFDLKQLPIEKLVKHVKKTELDRQVAAYTDVGDDELLEYIPEPVLERLNAALLKKYEAAGLPRTPTPAAKTAGVDKGRRFISMDESRGGSSRFK